MKESYARTAVKSVSWRITATITTVVLVYIFTSNITIALSLGLVEVVAKLVMYFFHDRIWQKCSWGLSSDE